jgi:hypothetical protein
MEATMAITSTNVEKQDMDQRSLEGAVEGEIDTISKRGKRRLERIQYQKEKKKMKKAAKREEREKMMLINPRKVCPRARGADPDPEIAEQKRKRNRGSASCGDGGKRMIVDP